MISQEFKLELSNTLAKHRLKGAVVATENGKIVLEINITQETRSSDLYKVILWDKETARTTYNSLTGQIQPRIFAQGNEFTFIFSLNQHLFVIFAERSTGASSRFDVSLTVYNAITLALLLLENKPPAIIDNATTLFYTIVTKEHKFTGNTKHFVGGELIGEVPALAICQYQDNKGYYLFRCDKNWTTITDTFHLSIEEAMEQAQYEYNGLTAEKWKQYKGP